MASQTRLTARPSGVSNGSPRTLRYGQTCSILVIVYILQKPYPKPAQITMRRPWPLFPEEFAMLNPNKAKKEQAKHRPRSLPSKNHTIRPIIASNLHVIFTSMRSERLEESRILLDVFQIQCSSTSDPIALPAQRPRSLNRDKLPHLSRKQCFISIPIPQPRILPYQPRAAVKVFSKSVRRRLREDQLGSLQVRTEGVGVDVFLCQGCDGCDYELEAGGQRLGDF